MKHLLIIFLTLLIPQTIFADDLSFFGSLENRGSFLGKNKIPIAENKGDGKLARTPVELDFNGTHYFKVGAGVKWRGFDLGFHYTDMDASNNLKDQFKDTFPLGTGIKGILPPGKTKLSDTNSDYVIDPKLYGTANTNGTADSKFSFNHYDLELGAVFKADKIAFRISAGARYAEYNQSLNVKRNNSWLCRMVDVVPATDPITQTQQCDDSAIITPGADIKDSSGKVIGRELDTHPNASFSNIRNLDMDITAFGPRIGLSLDAAYTKNISLVGSVNWAVLFSDRSIKDNYKATETTKIITKNGIPAIPAIPAVAEVPAKGSHSVIPARAAVPAVPAVPPVYGDPTINTVDQGGFIEKDLEKTIYNLELEAGIQYNMELSENSTLSFLVGYRYDTHIGAMTSCGSSKIEKVDGTKKTQASYGNCGTRLDDGSVNHGSGDNFTSHGPFIKTTISF